MTCKFTLDIRSTCKFNKKQLNLFSFWLTTEQLQFFCVSVQSVLCKIV